MITWSLHNVTSTMQPDYATDTLCEVLFERSPDWEVHILEGGFLNGVLCVVCRCGFLHTGLAPPLLLPIFSLFSTQHLILHIHTPSREWSNSRLFLNQAH